MIFLPAIVLKVIGGFSATFAVATLAGSNVIDLTDIPTSAAADPHDSDGSDFENELPPAVPVAASAPVASVGTAAGATAGTTTTSNTRTYPPNSTGSSDEYDTDNSTGSIDERVTPRDHHPSGTIQLAAVTDVASLRSSLPDDLTNHNQHVNNLPEEGRLIMSPDRLEDTINNQLSPDLLATSLNNNQVGEGEGQAKKRAKTGSTKTPTNILIEAARECKEDGENTGQCLVRHAVALDSPEQRLIVNSIKNQYTINLAHPKRVRLNFMSDKQHDIYLNYLKDARDKLCGNVIPKLIEKGVCTKEQISEYKTIIDKVLFEAHDYDQVLWMKVMSEIQWWVDTACLGERGERLFFRNIVMV